MENMKRGLWGEILPKRSAGAQLLRDAALGHKEYPDVSEMTATDVETRMKKYVSTAGAALVHNMDKHILDSMTYAMVKTAKGKVRIVSS